MTKIAPRQIKGAWNEGYALDIHTVSSTLIGYDEYGHEKFETEYTEIGGLLYRLKSKGDKSSIDTITSAAADFVKSKKWDFDLVIPVPPSNFRSFQPVIALADQLAKNLGVPFCADCLEKTKKTPGLKNIFDPRERTKLLEGAFSVNRAKIEGKRVLLFDDLYRSGATMNEVCSALKANGHVKDIYALTVTMTRTRR
jgi:predicted amidophosphoribosyltransferase